MSEVLYQGFLSHYQIKCLYHRVIFDDTGPCSIEVSNPRPHAFIEKIVINSDRSFITLALLINVCSPLLSITVLFPENWGRETLCLYVFHHETSKFYSKMVEQPGIQLKNSI